MKLPQHQYEDLIKAGWTPPTETPEEKGRRLADFLCTKDAAWEPDYDKYEAVFEATTQVLSFAHGFLREHSELWCQLTRMELLRRKRDTEGKRWESR